jgi:uncharacterized protein YqgC (DUF456 family)
MEILWALLLVAAAVLLWGLNLIGLPGNWLIVMIAVIYAWAMPAESRADITWWAIGGLASLALLGEALEFLAGALGAAKAGASRRAAVMALGGSLAGGIVGLFVGVPIPVIGSLVGAVVFAGLGALTGAYFGERWKGKDVDESLRVGQAALFGRMLGTLGKSLAGGVMVALLVAAVLV